MIEKRKIGRLADITPVGLGCMGFSHAYGAPLERKEAVGMIRKPTKWAMTSWSI